MSTPALRDICRTCAQPITQNPQGLAREYCNEKCRRRARYRRSLGRPVADTTPAPTHCACGRSLAGMNHGAKHCSDRCAARARYAPGRALIPSPAHCLTCRASLAGRNHGTMYCSRKCGNRSRARAKRGVPTADPQPRRRSSSPD